MNALHTWWQPAWTGNNPCCSAQAAWIANDSVRGNILFGKEYDQARYDEVVEACSLSHDFEARPQANACRCEPVADINGYFGILSLYLTP